MYSFVEHTGELELVLTAGTPEELFAEALAAFRDLVADGAVAGTEALDVHVSAADGPGLLVAWLEELIFLAETRNFVPVEVERLELRDPVLDAVLLGEVREPRHLVKAVTYNRLELKHVDGRWHGRVVLDV